MTSKQRAFLRSLCNSIDPIINVGKGGISPELTITLEQCLETKELVKVAVLNNCDEDIKELANTLSERTNSELVTVIGRKAVFYKESKNNKKIDMKNLKIIEKEVVKKEYPKKENKKREYKKSNR